MKWFTESRLWKTMLTQGWCYTPSINPSHAMVVYPHQQATKDVYILMSTLIWIESLVDPSRLMIEYVAEFRFDITSSLDKPDVDLDQYLKSTILDSNIEDKSKKFRLLSLGIIDTPLTSDVDESTLSRN